MQHAVGFDLRHQRQLRLEHGYTAEIKPFVALLRENLTQPSRVVGLKVRGAKLTQHGIISGPVCMVECQQCGPDQDQDAIVVDVRRFWGVGHLGRRTTILLSLCVGGKHLQAADGHDQGQPRQSAHFSHPPAKAAGSCSILGACRQALKLAG
ncbi:hypothetical protein NLY36_11605 [Mesorhizobium sp. C399B]|uniref:hypothetical protein n=1 Tax=Mesorhizobium sp. C399B TaxID=2956833 RepID=UPI00257917EE|nr:hypothetical protein [Mesorhizobium sp. C399B]WJI71388.1 hypothetical protein NLY36_11605 [Mesorhizobium sp. C399B]